MGTVYATEDEGTVSGTSSGGSETTSSSTSSSSTANSSSDINPSETGANGRVNVFIRTAAGKNIGDDVTSLESMTEDDIKFLGVYISNFFVPFGTELGSTSEITEENKKDIVEALQTNLNFSDTMASSFSETILGLTRSNNKELVLCISNEYQKELTPLDGIELSYYTAFQTLSGRLPELIVEHERDWCMYALAGYSTEEINSITGNEPETIIDENGDEIEVGTTIEKYNPEVISKILSYNDCTGLISEISNQFNVPSEYKSGTQYYKYAYFAYKDSSGEYIPVFDMSLYGDFMTPSMLAFFKCLQSIEFENGYGTNILDFSKNEISADNSGSQKILDTVEEDKDLYDMSMYGMRLRVDCFGNLICMGANHQFIMVPACMNPYVWQAVDENGNDVTDKPAGSIYNMINVPSLNMYDNNMLFSNVSSDTSDGLILVSKGTPVTKGIANRLSSSYYTGTIDGTKITKSDAFFTCRVVRGSKKTQVYDAGVISKNDTTLDLLTRITNAALSSGDCFFYKIKNSKFLCFNWETTSSIEMMAPKISNNSLACATNKISFFTGMQFIDNLQTYKFNKNNNEDIDWSTFNTTSYLSDGGSSPKGSWKEVETGFKNKFSSIKDGDMEIVKSTSSEATVMIYVTYAYAGLYEASTKADTIGKIGFRMFFDSLPEVSNSPLSISDDAKEDIMSTSIKQWLYYLLKPDDGFNYTRILLTNKINAFLLGWHNSMLGTQGVGVVTGTTKYRGNIGYVTTPDLSEMEWTDKLITWYENALPFLIIFMLVIFVFIYMTKTLSLQKCIFGLCIFAFCSLMPVPLINGVIGSSNRIISNLYGEKFTYWAMVQHETYTTAIDEAASGDSYGNYLRTLYAENSKININQGTESVMLKWQAPKKMVSLMLSSSDTSVLNSFRQSFIMGAVNNAYSGESYLANDDATFLYRSYIDVANFSRYIYSGIKDGVRKSYNDFSVETNLGGFSEPLKTSFEGFSDKYTEDRKNGYTNVHGSGGTGIKSGTSVEAIHLIAPLTSKIVSSAMTGLNNVGNLTINDYVGLNQDFFNFSIPMFTVENMDIVKELTNSAKSENFGNILSQFTEEDLVGLAAYGLYSENVFYYFSWLLYDSGLYPDSSYNTGYKTLLLGKDNAGFFYNSEGNGELKDFMDMKSLFTYIIPYLNEGNKIVRQWDDTYGIKVYGGVSTEEGHLDEYSSDPELKQKYWHNLNVARLYNIYTPWVDLMYECSYADPEYIEVLGEKVLIEDPINPASYPENRPMVFSRSEMEDYGLNETHLTQVERLIIECNDEMQERMFELLNYHNFNDVVLNTAAAMECAFVFNETFSENSLFGSNINIYPQSMELNDFSYDAFLRFILANATGESMTNTEDFYENIVTSSSMTTIIVMLILDIVSVYVLPGMKIIFVVLIFISSIFVILVSIFHVDENQKFIKRMFTSLIQPMLSFFLISVGMAYAISLFMGTGNNSVTQTQTATIQLGDPVMVMFAMLLIDIVCIVMYYKVVSKVWYSVKCMGKVLTGFGTGLVLSVGGMVTNSAITRAVQGVGKSSGGYYSGSGTDMGMPNERASLRGSQGIEGKEVHHYMYVSPDKWDKKGGEKGLQRDVAELQTARDYYGNIEVRDSSNKEKTYNIDDLINKGMKKIDGLDNYQYYEKEVSKRQEEFKKDGKLGFVKESKKVETKSDRSGSDSAKRSFNNKSNSVGDKKE